MLEKPEEIDYCLNVLFVISLLLIFSGGVYYVATHAMGSFSIIQYSEGKNIHAENVLSLQLIKMGVVALIGLQFIKLMIFCVQYITTKKWGFLGSALIILGVLSYSNFRFYFHS